MLSKYIYINNIFYGRVNVEKYIIRMNDILKNHIPYHAAGGRLAGHTVGKELLLRPVYRNNLAEI